MNFITSPTKILGLDASDLSIKALQLEQKHGAYEIRAWNSFNLPKGLIEEGVIKDFDKTAQAIRNVIETSKNKFTTKYAVLSLPETKTFIKVIEVPRKNGSTREIIEKELPRHVPVDLNEIELDWQEVADTPKKRKFLIGIVPKKIADDYVKVAEMAGLSPVALEIEAQAIVRSIIKSNHNNNGTWWKKVVNNKLEQNCKKTRQNPILIVDLGATRTSLILINNGVIQFTNSLSHISGELITANIAEIMKLPYKDAEKLKKICGDSPKKCKGKVRDIIKKMISSLAEEVKNAEIFYESHFSESTRGMELLLCSGGSNLIEVDKDIGAMVNRQAFVANPLINIKHNMKTDEQKNFLPYTTAIGLALRKIA